MQSSLGCGASRKSCRYHEMVMLDVDILLFEMAVATQGYNVGFTVTSKSQDATIYLVDIISQFF